MERTKQEIDAAIARMDNVLALSSNHDDRTAWLLLRGELRKRPRRPSEKILVPMSAASMHIAASIQHAHKALHAMGDAQSANREEDVLLTPAIIVDDEG